MKILVMLLALMPAVAMAQSCGEFAQEFWQAASYRDMSMPPQSVTDLVANKPLQPNRNDKAIVSLVFFKYPNKTPKQIGHAAYRYCHKIRLKNPSAKIMP